MSLAAQSAFDRSRLSSLWKKTKGKTVERLVDVWPGLEVSRGHFHEDRAIQCLVRDAPFETKMLRLQGYRTIGLIDAQATVFLLSTVVRLLGDPELPTGVKHHEAYASLKLDRSPLLKDLLGRISLLGHDHDLPGCGPVSHSV